MCEETIPDCTSERDCAWNEPSSAAKFSGGATTLTSAAAVPGKMRMPVVCASAQDMDTNR